MPKMTVYMDGVVIKEIELTKPRTTLGRRPYNDIVIDNLAVSGEHAVFLLANGQVTLEDLNSTNGSYVNGKAVKSQPLHDNDQLEIGRYKIFFHAPAPAQALPVAVPAPVAASEAPPVARPAAPAPGNARIAVVSGPAAGREMALVKVVTTLGKPGVAVAALTQRNEGYTIALVDGEVVPTLNGQPIGSNAQHLKHGDVIVLAGTEMHFLQG